MTILMFFRTLLLLIAVCDVISDNNITNNSVIFTDDLDCDENITCYCPKCPGWYNCNCLLHLLDDKRRESHSDIRSYNKIISTMQQVCDTSVYVNNWYAYTFDECKNTTIN